MEQPKRTSQLDTVNHRCFIGKGGVTLYSTDGLDLEEGQEPQKDHLLLLSPVEAIQIAEQVLAHRAQLDAQQPELDAQFERVSQTLVAFFPELWKRYCHEKKRHGGGDHSSFLDFELVVTDAYNRLIFDESGMVGQWYATIWTDTYSHEQLKALFWRHFNRYHREQLLDQYLPTTLPLVESEE